MQPKKKDPQEKKWLKEYGKYSSLGFQMMFVILAGAFAGHYLDQYLENSKPVLTIILTLFGLIIALYILFKSISKTN